MPKPAQSRKTPRKAPTVSNAIDYAFSLIDARIDVSTSLAFSASCRPGVGGITTAFGLGSATKIR